MKKGNYIYPYFTGAKNRILSVFVLLHLKLYHA
jgi:hypothetical protein